VHPTNPRYYFADPAGRAVYLTGSHTWAVIQERTYEGLPPFDFDAYLGFMAGHGHNFLRLWTWEHAAWMQFTDRRVVYRPLAYLRTGPGTAADGGPKFDLSRFDPAYFARLRERVAAAGDRGVYVSVMLFQGFSIEQKGTVGVDEGKGNPWDGHPFNVRNNINGIDGDLNGNGEGEEVHTLACPEITARQEAYVRKVVDTVNDFDHVLFEIANESHAGSTGWQYHMIRFIHDYERTKPKQHPVSMTYQYGGRARTGTNAALFASPAEWISPNPEGGYKTDPPPADGRKVVLNDTDHLWGIGGNSLWVWKSFLRGHHPIFMDPYRDVRTGPDVDAQWDPVRRSMGHTRSYAERMDLAAAAPRGDLASTGYCLAASGRHYLVLVPEGGSVTVDLAGVEGRFEVEWFGVATGQTVQGDPVQGGAKRTFTAPIGAACVLYLHSDADRE